MSDPIIIRRAETIADYRACQAAQRAAWGLVDASYVVPVATLVGAQLHGGLVLGAFEPSGAAVGVSFAFLGRISSRLGLYSQLTGVVPGAQRRGIGARLKHAQRDFARDQNLPVIAWAFDPLQAGNARFNLAQLGATAGRYIEDMYGPRTDALSAGRPTDRLIVEWETDGPPRPHARLDAATAWLVESSAVSGTWWVCLPALLANAPPLLALEIPADINSLRKENPAAADASQQAVRQGFVTAFQAGYRAVGFTSEQRDGMRRECYLLGRRGPED